MSRKIHIPKEELRRLYLEEKLTTHQIAEIFDCCQGTIWKRLKKYKIPTRKPRELNSNVPSKRELKELYIEKKLSTWQIEELYGYARSTVHRKLKEYGIPTRNIAQSHIIYPRKKFDGDKKEKAYLIGFSVGDLRVRKIGKKSETINVECGTTRKAQINLVKLLFQNYGKVWITKPNKKGARSIGVGLDLSFSFLLKNKVPKWIFRDRDHFFSFLGGFTDAEGYIKVKSGRAVYGLGNYNSKLLFSIYEKLNELDINCPEPYKYDITDYYGADGYGHNKPYWTFAVHRKGSLLELLNVLESYLKHKQKIKGLKRAKENIKKRNKKYGG